MVRKAVMLGVLELSALGCVVTAQVGPVGPPGGDGGRFKPGWNGKARTPPLGWRSWNAFGNRIYDSTIRDAIDAITAKNWSVNGEMVSLADVGYASVGIDEGWEGCGMGVNHTQHYINGTPAVNSKFPNMKDLVDYGHSKNLHMGFYQNGCACGEREEKLINYEGDVAYLNSMGFDAVKLDGCGHQRNMTLYAELMQKTGKNYSIENCHWGHCDQSDDSSCPTVDWCPFNWYRSSGDINAGTMSWFNNLQTTIRFQSWDAPVSQPGCWAYPDMLEVGRVSGPKSWNRAHFGAWCIVSAPLVLGMELTQEILEPVIDVIANKEAIAVNQAWAGHPGSLVWEQNLPPPAPPPPGSPLYVAAMDCDPSDKAQNGWEMTANSAIRYKGSCLDASDSSQIQVETCDGSASQNFIFDGTNIKNGNSCLDVWYYSGPRVDLYACNNGYNQRFTLGRDGTLKEASGVFGQANVEGGGKCLGVTAVKPGSGSTSDLLQLWAKPQESGAVAVLIINTAPDQNTTAQIDFSKLNMTSGSVKARNIWEHSDLPGTQSDSMTVPVPAQDSVFLLLSPVS